MMSWTPVAFATVAIYSTALIFIFVYSMTQLSLVLAYRKARSRNAAEPKPESNVTEDWLPMVTVQLPVYNEMYVAERLIKSVAALDYPKDKLEIQVLDDSTDETVDIIREQVQSLHEQGVNIQHVRRPSREGFKAGALAYGMEKASGEFIAIFDADFLPEKDFLRRTLAPFRDEHMGMVQTRWGHVNEGYSLLTKLQAFGLDAHFSVEQKGRNTSGYFINFNGTAGVWRKSCIVDAGGWAADTLTEDLDLSYRAQLRGWKFHFMEEVTTPAELPVTISALKNQQYRWNKGAAECAKKNLPKVLRRKDISAGKKLHASLHLMNSSIFIAIMVTALLSLPMLLIKHSFEQLHVLYWFASFFLMGFVILGIFYYTACADAGKSIFANLWKFIRLFPLFLSISMGLALHNAIAVIEGYAGRKTSFVRTPKFNITAAGDQWFRNKYLESGLSWVTILEGVLATYFAWGILVGIRLDDYGLMPFHIMLTFGFGSVFIYSILHSRRMNRLPEDSPTTGGVALSA